jgi:probable F420-dependent oxidoreductase
MASRHAFRFGVINERTAAPNAWIAHVRQIEAFGYSTLLIRDHFAPDYFGDQFAPIAALTAAACATNSLRVGTLVFDNDYRHPVMLAKEAATLDLLSGGRLELGLGAGWLQSEYNQAGMAYDPPAVRIQRLSEAITVLKGLFAELPLTFAGAHYTINELNGFPKPAQRPHPPILIGGGGPKRTPELTARFASEHNVFGGDHTVFSERRRRVTEACERIGRDPATVRFSWAGPTIVGTDEQDLRRRSQVRLDYNNQKDEVGGWIAEMRKHGMMIATVEQAVQQIDELKAAGCSRWYFQFVPVEDHGMLELIADKVIPAVA